MTAPGPLREDEVEKPSLYGPDGALRRFTRAANGLHAVAEKVRERRRASAEAEAEIVARVIEPQAWWHLNRADDTGTFANWRGSSLVRARAAILRLDQVRGK